MKQKVMMKKIIAISMACMMVFLSAGMHIVTAKAEEKKENVSDVDAQQKMDRIEPSTGYYDIGHVAARLENEDAFGGLEFDQATIIPDTYSSVNKGYVTPVKNQGPWGTCWAFAACAAMESYALSHGLVNSPNMVDFSEYALAYLTFKDDLYAEKTGDYTTTTDLLDVGFNAGGNDEIAFKTLSKWAGIYNEGTDTYYADSKPHSKGGTKDNEAIPAYNTNNAKCDFVLTGQYYINVQDTEQVKAAIMENGAVTASYYSHDSYTKHGVNAPYLYNYNYGYEGTNHAIAIVGWNDNIDRANFTMIDADGISHTPKQNGAWLVKNSWGTACGENGYIWISYEDLGILSSDVVVYEIAPKEMYDNIYQHDGATVYYAGISSTKFATIYTVEGEAAQKIQAVSFAVIGVTNRSYRIDIYKKDGNAVFESGTLVASTTGKTTYEGYYTALLEEPVKVNPNESYSIVISFDEPTYMLWGYNGLQLGGGGVSTTVSTSKEGECYKYSNGNFLSFYDDAGRCANLCIKMYTTNVVEFETPQITDVVLDSKDKATILWQTVEDAVGYELWIGQTSHDDAPMIVQVMNDVQNSYDSYTLDVELGTNYYFKVRAIFGEQGNYTYSEYSVIYFYQAEIPAVVLQAEQVDNSITISWSEIPYVDGYRVFRSKDNGEYQLIKEITSLDTIRTFTDSNLKYGSTYQYYVVSYIESPSESISHISNKQTINVAVPVVSDFEVNDYFYQRMEFSWTALTDIASGYEISLYATDENGNTTSNVPFKTIDVVGAASNYYEYDTSSHAPGTFLYVSIRAYIMLDESTKVKSSEVYSKYLCTVMDKPIDVEVEWYVKNQNGSDYIVLLVNAPEEDGIYLYYYDAVNKIQPDMTRPINLENGKAELQLEAQSIPFLHKGYLYFSNENITAAFQDEPIEIGGAYRVPELEVLEDVQCMSGEHSAELRAVIKNPLKNFDYRYQWYVAEGPTGEGVAIEGANADTYVLSVGSSDQKYYYCVVTVEYSEFYTVSTVNERGEHTCVVGELFGADVTVGNIADQEYCGSAILPELIIKAGEAILVEGTDYTVVYIDNINVGKAVGTITFINNYVHCGTAKVYFNIVPKKAEKLNYSQVESLTYSGKENKPLVIVKDDEKLLEVNKDYIVEYYNNINAGTAVITLKFQGNYQDEWHINFTIKQKSADGVVISNNSMQKYTGVAVLPELTIMDGNLLLENGKDYTFTCTNNVLAGTATAKIVFKGNYEGNKEINYTIQPRPAEDLTINAIPNQEYAGVGIVPEVVIKYGENRLKKGDYSISYTNNIQRGTANVTINFVGNYSGTRTVTFEIVQKTAEHLNYELIKAQTYSGELLKPDAVIKNGDIRLVKGTDYDIVYSNNLNVGTATATITFKGNYIGSKTLNFTIEPKSGNNCSVAPIPDAIYTGSAIEPVVEVKDGEKVLQKDIDYSIGYHKNVNAGEAIVTIMFKGNYTGSLSRSFEIKPMEIKDAVISNIPDQIYNGKAIIPNIQVLSGKREFKNGVDYTAEITNNVNAGVAKVSVTFKGNYCGRVETTFKIVPRTTAKVVISKIENQKYTGKAIEPELVIKDGDIVLVKGQDYEVEFKNNVNAGTASAIVSFKGNFAGAKKEVTFNITDQIPTAITSSSVTIGESNGYMSKISVGTTVSKLLSCLNEQRFVSVLDKKGEKVAETSVVGTGMTAAIMDGNKATKKYTIVVTGDTNGDGKINITDMIAVKACTLKKSDLSGAYEKAGDVNGDGKINITDFIKIKATTLKKDSITGVPVK